MANEEHLAILKQGVETWNKWREANQNLVPDLREADLSGKNLIEANLYQAILIAAALQKANLEKANLIGADLRDASLSKADIRDANLNEAKLIGALLVETDLRGANLSRTDLRNANLRGARLGKADLINADLSRADLTKAALNESVFGDTNLGNIDLSEAIGLEEVIHRAPSTIGIDSLYMSKGKIPEIFLRGCGVPENLITFMHSLVDQAIEFYSCFISYSSKNDDFAKRLHADLQSKGVRVWFAPEDLKIGDKFRSRIDEAIRVYDKLLLVLSEHSIKSDWVEKEVETAFEKERQQKRTMLFPVRLDDSVMETDQAWAADIRLTRHIGDMCGWKDHDSYQVAFERLLRDLRAGEGKV
jgi:hypothetical protein